MFRSLHLGLVFSLLLVAPMGPGAAIANPQISQRTEARGVSTTSRFTITYPDHWLETSNNNRDYVIIYNQPPPAFGGQEAPPYMIKTDVGLQNISLRQALQIYRDEPGRVRQIQEVTVNGRLGVRVWESSEGWDFPDSIITYIPMSDSAVIYAISFYSRQNQYAEPAILGVHNSLQVR